MKSMIPQMKTTDTKIGHTHFKRKRTTGYVALSTPPSAVSSAFISSLFHTQPTKIDVRMPRIGNITIAVKLSSSAKKFIPARRI